MGAIPYQRKSAYNGELRIHFVVAEIETNERTIPWEVLLKANSYKLVAVRSDPVTTNSKEETLCERESTCVRG